MGSERFQNEYIEHLQNRNAELLERLTNMRKIYENKIFSKDLKQHYFISTLMDVLNVCTVIPEEIDLLYDKMSEAMSVLINILSRKSTLIQLGEKISKMLNPPNNGELMDGQSAEKNDSSNTARKAGTVKVSPMINGHIISTEPRICLNRVSGNYIPNRRSDTHRLSPILEMSPDVRSEISNANNYIFKELEVVAERVNIEHATYNYINQESPKGRFKGTKIWKKSLSSNGQNQKQKETNSSQSNENIQKPDGETGQSENGFDATAGPSRPYDEGMRTKSCPTSYVDIRRRRHRYSRVFNKNKDDSYFKSKIANSEKINENIFSDDEHGSAENLKNLEKESSGSLTNSDVENTPRAKKQGRSKKRRDNNIEETCDSDKARKRRSCRFTNSEKKDSDVSDSSYEGDNEENYSGKSKGSRKSCGHNRSKSLFDLERTKSLPVEESAEPRFDSEETQNSHTKNKPVNYDTNVLIKDALGKEAQVSVEDCMKKQENSKKEKSSHGRSNASGSNPNSKIKSLSMNSSNDSESTGGGTDKSFTNQNQRSKRKAAPTNLTEPKLGTKLRRN